MPGAAYYPKANRDVQNFAGRYGGSRITPNVLVLHTTESGTWPSYSSGSVAPTLTAYPDRGAKRLVWRQHFPLTMSARALQNLSGGVETNTLNAVQIELVGTCTKTYRDKYGYFYWPAAPDWALQGVADFLAWLHKEWPKVALEAAPKWLPYPSSYGNTPVRMSGAQWSNFYGVCGHQHVPENVHGDPGDIDAARIVTLAKGRSDVRERPVGPSKPEQPKPRPLQAVRASLREIRRDSHNAVVNARVSAALKALRAK